MHSALSALLSTFSLLIKHVRRRVAHRFWYEGCLSSRCGLAERPWAVDLEDGHGSATHLLSPQAEIFRSAQRIAINVALMKLCKKARKVEVSIDEQSESHTT